MTRGFTIFPCQGCRAALFPQRLLCPKCHGTAFASERIEAGVVEDTSTTRHMIGQTDWKPRRIANVLTVDGLRITVGLQDNSSEGAVIDLYDHDGAPLGVAAGKPAPAS